MKIFFFLLFLPSFIFADEIFDAVNSKFRMESNVERDKYRNPSETLNFFNLNSDMNVLEILPGKGWYTEILGLILKDKGKLTVASFGSDHENKNLRKIHNEFENYFVQKKEIFGNIIIDIFYKKKFFPNIDSRSQDIVLTFRNTHNLVKRGIAEKVYREVHRILVDGGTLGVVQHRASKIDVFDKDKYTGYFPEKYVIDLIENCGFKLVEKSDINSNFKDKKNYQGGVWSLPPTLRSGKKKHYISIGESDRMTLRFIKK